MHYIKCLYAFWAVRLLFTDWQGMRGLINPLTLNPSPQGEGL